MEAVRTTSDMAVAEVSWRDFLLHWSRALNKCDAVGRAAGRTGWELISKRIERDECLFFLKAARNAEEHSIAPVAQQRQPTAIVHFATVVGDGLVIDRDANIGIDLDQGLSLVFVPGSIHLVSIRDRGRTVAPPLLGGFPMTPVALMEHGLTFLDAEIANSSAASQLGG